MIKKGIERKKTFPLRVCCVFSRQELLCSLCLSPFQMLRIYVFLFFCLIRNCRHISEQANKRPEPNGCCAARGICDTHNTAPTRTHLHEMSLYISMCLSQSSSPSSSLFYFDPPLFHYYVYIYISEAKCHCHFVQRIIWTRPAHFC